MSPVLILSVILAVVAMAISFMTIANAIRRRPIVRHTRRYRINDVDIDIDGEVRLSTNDFQANMDALTADMDRLVADGQLVMNGPGGSISMPTGTARSPKTKMPKRAGWKCEYCGSVNDTARCVSCGAPQKDVPEDPPLDEVEFDVLIDSLRETPFGHDQLRVLAAFRAASYTSDQVVRILRCFTFGHDQVRALALLIGTITDPGEGAAKILSCFTFGHDKSLAAQLLAGRR